MKNLIATRSTATKYGKALRRLQELKLRLKDDSLHLNINAGLWIRLLNEHTSAAIRCRRLSGELARESRPCDPKRVY